MTEEPTPPVILTRILPAPSHDATKITPRYDLGSGSEEQFWRKVEGHISSLGLGRPEIHYAKVRSGNQDIITVLVDKTRPRTIDGEPTCETIQGALAGLLAKRYRKKVKSEETKCRTSGAAHCIFTFQLGQTKTPSPFRRFLSAVL
ncbi:MAG TPA: V4R domain-containing protein [Candidatus Saccharimonadales bacterium]|nr:V4R domain-containing protein [Candidatus Saccharimonadales bacterium]